MRKLTNVFKALSDSNRLRIIKMLEVISLCVCEITEILKLASSTVSKHLSLLHNAELILDEKDGKWVNYYLNQEQTDDYVQQLLPLINSFLPEDKIIAKDKEKVQTVDCKFICGSQKFIIRVNVQYTFEDCLILK